MRILIVSDAWRPQINGVVRTLETLVQELRTLGHTVHVICSDGFRTAPLPTCPEIRLALRPWSAGAMGRWGDGTSIAA